MKTELSLKGFSEIPGSEQEEINGGLLSILAGILIGIATAASAQIMSDWDNFKNGLMGLPEEK